MNGLFFSRSNPEPHFLGDKILRLKPSTSDLELDSEVAKFIIASKSKVFSSSRLDNLDVETINQEPF